MLSAMAALLQSAQEAPLVAVPFVADPFIRMPSLFTIIDMLGTSLIGYALWRLYKQRKGGPDTVTPQEFRRLVGRLDAIEFAASERDKRDQSFRHDVIEANSYQLAEMQKQTAMAEKTLNKLTYVATTLDSRPCVMNGNGECPEEQ